MSTKMDYIAVSEKIDDGFVGRVVFWTPKSEVPYDEVCNALRGAGFGEEDAGEHALIPTRTSPTTALQRALKDVASNNGNYVRSIGESGRGKKNKKGWIVASDRTVQSPHAGGVAATVDLVLRINDASEDDIRIDFEPSDHPSCDLVLNRYEHYRNYLTGDDISYFLTQRVAKSPLFSLVPVRPSGGFYYASPQAVQLWDQFATAFEGATKVKFYHINVLRDQKSFVEAAVAAITEQMCKRMDELQEAIKTSGVRKMRNASEEIADMLRMAQSHEIVLGASLSAMKERAEKLSSIIQESIAAEEARSATSIA